LSGGLPKSTIQKRQRCQNATDFHGDPFWQHPEENRHQCRVRHVNARERVLPYRINVLMAEVAIRFDLLQFAGDGASPSFFQYRI
jgi:hypothetical protein